MKSVGVKWILMVFVAIIIATLVSGCGTLPTEATEQGSITRTVKKTDGSTETIANKSDYAAYLDKMSEAKTFKMSCPPTGCVFASLEVPLAGGDVKVAAPPTPPKSAGVAIVEGFFSLGHAVIGQSPWYFGSKVLTKAFEVANSSVDNSNRSVDNSNNSVDSSNRSTTTTTTTTNTDNSNRSTNSSNNRSCNTGAPTGTTGQTGSSGPANC